MLFLRSTRCLSHLPFRAGSRAYSRPASPKSSRAEWFVTGAAVILLGGVWNSHYQWGQISKKREELDERIQSLCRELEETEKDHQDLMHQFRDHCYVSESDHEGLARQGGQADKTARKLDDGAGS